MRLALRLPATLFGLTVLWVALWDDLSAANVIAGLVVAVGVVVVARLEPSTGPGVHVHPFLAVRYVLVLGWKLLVANLRLAREILTPGIGTYTGIIAVPMRSGSDDVVTLVANSVTLTPGTMTVEVRRDGQDVTLYVHGLYTRDIEGVRREIMQLETLALRAFGTDEEAAAASQGLRRQDAVVESHETEEER